MVRCFCGEQDEVRKGKKKIHQSLGIPSEGMLQSHFSPVNKHFSSGKALGGTGGHLHYERSYLGKLKILK